MELDFDQWLEIGVRSGWVSPPVCYTHDGLPTSVTEDAEFEDGSDLVSISCAVTKAKHTKKQ
jgi:hypothetical protein